MNIQPATRKARQAQLFREDLEKMRLRSRRENYCHYEEASLVQPPDSLGYISDADRFVTDIAGVAKVERDAEVRKREQMHYAKRLERANKEEVRWGWPAAGMGWPLPSLRGKYKSTRVLNTSAISSSCSRSA